MTVDVTVETFIARPRDDVARYAMDPTNDAVWIGGISEAVMLTGPPVDIGTQVARVAKFLGRRIEYVNEVTRYEPPAALAMRSVRGPFPMRITYTFDEADGGCTARIRVEGDASGFYRLAAPLLGAAVKRSIAGDVRNLKRLMESGADGA